MSSNSPESPIKSSSEVPLEERCSDVAVEIYSSMLQHEQLPPDLDELIPTPHLNQADRDRLLQTGIDEASISQGQIRRGDLLGAGFSFINRIGGGEKPILSSVPYSLLTSRELDALRSAQQPNLGEPDIEGVRLKMIDFWLRAATVSDEQARRLPDIEAEMMKQAAEFIWSLNTTDAEKEVIMKYIRSITDASPGIQRLVKGELFNGLFPVELGSIPVAFMPTRFSVLKGLPSPFLDSGFHFDMNLDVTLFDEEPEKTRRLNSVVIHLLSRGVEEDGGSINGSHDQSYLTSAEFKDLLPASYKNAEPLALAKGEAVRTLVVRILARTGLIDKAEEVM